MKCEQCGHCCGIVMCSVDEYKIIKDYIEKHNITPKAQESDCPFLLGSTGSSRTCAIYPVRPYTCKLFGHTHTLMCKYRHNKNIPLYQVEILNEKHMIGETTCLHEFCYETSEIEKIIANELEKAKSRLDQNV
jgi:Fe-S-cluster containining protein